MKPFILFVFIGVCSLKTYSQINDYSLPLVPIFIDEFEKGEVDTLFWRDKRFYKSHTRFWPAGVREQQYYIKFDEPLQNPADNYIFEIDNLIGKEIISLTATNTPITADAVDGMDPNQVIPEDNLGLTNNRTFNFRSAELISRMRFKYGMFFIRFKMPKGCGFWPAFWLYSGTHSDFNCVNSSNDPNFQPPSYCAGDEIDFFEWESENPTFLPANLHYDHQNTAGALQYDIPTNQNLTDDYHLLVIEWQPSDYDSDGIVDDGFLNWYFDPHIYYYNYPLYPNYHQVHKYDFNMSLDVNNAVGGPPYNVNYNSDNTNFLANCINGGTSSVGAAQFPAKFSIDYISVFYRYNCEATANVCSWDPLRDLPAYTGGTINVAGNNCSVIVPGYEHDQWNNVIDGNDLKFIASEKIVLKPGFHAKKGSRVSAVIEYDCPRSMGDNMMMTDTGSISIIQYFQKLKGNKEQVTQNQPIINSMDKNEIYFKIYPNPTDGIFYLKYSLLLLNSDKVISIYNHLGQLLMVQNENVTEFDLSNYSNGIYFLEVQTENGTYREKIIKQ